MRILALAIMRILALAITQKRTVLTLDRYDFVKLHRASTEHLGIIVCTNDRNWTSFAARIDEAITSERNLRTKLIGSTRPGQ